MGDVSRHEPRTRRESAILIPRRCITLAALVGGRTTWHYRREGTEAVAELHAKSPDYLRYGDVDRSMSLAARLSKLVK